MNATEAFGGLVTIVGTGGLATILVAFIGLKSAKQAKAQAEASVSSPVGDVLRAEKIVEPLTNAISTLAGAVNAAVPPLVRLAEQQEEDAEQRRADERAELRALAENIRGGRK